MLSGLAERLDELTAASDIVGRIEGDCFGLLLDHSNEESAAETAEKIISGVRETPIKTVIGDVAITVSVGGIVFQTSAQTSFNIMSRAEMALRQAKKEGRNHYVVYQLTEMQRQSLRQDMSIAKEVQEALLDNRLVLAYQPIVDTMTSDARLYECLLRMRRPDGQILPAGAFVPVVEQLGLMRQIDRCTLHLAMEELFNDPYVRLTLNISGMTASDQAWLRTLVSYLRGKPEVGSRLTIEITETVVLQDLEESARFVSSVRELGCAVALDDFGAGYTSFHNLQALAVDMVKIVGTFITDLEDKPDNQLFIRTLLGLARGFGLTKVAECVETEAEAEILKREGVTYLQGYLYGRPELTRPANNKIISLADVQKPKPKLEISTASQAPFRKSAILCLIPGRMTDRASAAISASRVSIAVASASAVTVSASSVCIFSVNTDISPGHSSAAETPSINPISSASAALIGRDSVWIARARPAPIRRARRRVPRMTPKRGPGMKKLVSGVAITRIAADAKSAPAPTARPCTKARTGTGQ